jgi:hypothetical protein
MKRETIETKDGEAQVAEAETDISDSATTIVVVSTATFSPSGRIAVSDELDYAVLSRRQQKKTTSKETVNLPVIRYRDTNGNPTCYANEGVCQFLRTFEVRPSWHTRSPYYTCCLDESSLPIRGRDDGTGSLIPIDKCPLWEGVER